MSYRVKPIPEAIADQVRRTMRSPQYGHPAFVETAAGYGPCRQCLGQFETGVDRRILFTYNAFDGIADLPLPGPVFIHEENCKTYDADGFPDGLIGLPLLFESFSGSVLIGREPVAAASVDGQLRGILGRRGVDFVYVRNAEAGCFVALVERS